MRGSFPRVELFWIFLLFLKWRDVIQYNTIPTNNIVCCTFNLYIAHYQSKSWLFTLNVAIFQCLSYFPFPSHFFRTQRASFSCKYSCSVLLPAILRIFLNDEEIVHYSSVKSFFAVWKRKLWQQAAIASTQQCAQSCMVYDRGLYVTHSAMNIFSY